MFKQMFSAKYVCHLCRAHVGIARLLFTDFRRDAHLRNRDVAVCRYISALWVLGHWPDVYNFGNQ